MDDDELFGLIRAGHETLDDDSVDAFDQEADRVLRRAKVPAEGRRPSRVGRRRLRLAVAVAAIAAVSAGATWLILRPAERLPVTCLADIDRDADAVGLIPDGLPSLEACEQAWEDGILTNPTIAPGEIPELVGCVDDGLLIVIPSSDPAACFLIDAEPADPDKVDPALDDVAAAQAELLAWWEGEDCPSIPEAAAVAEQVRAEHLPSWTLTVVERPSDWCAAFGLDEVTSEVVVAGYPPPD